MLFGVPPGKLPNQTPRITSVLSTLFTPVSRVTPSASSADKTFPSALSSHRFLGANTG
jgi:hypothetical protein